MVNEILMSHVWKYQLFNHKELFACTGEKISIIHPGIENSNAGADFQQAKIRINDLEWIGTVELHVYASDWMNHEHQHDLAYENVILHVVWKYDQAIYYQNGGLIPTLELQWKVDDEALKKIETTLLNPKSQLICGAKFEQASVASKEKMLEKCLKERLDLKVFQIDLILKSTNSDWEETFYQALAKSFGFSLNSEPMFRLVQSLPLRLILRYRDRPFGVESALFGLGGLLEEPIKDAYQWELRREFIHLRKKHDWPQNYLNSSDWKFLRMRPPNFPTIRLAQFTEIIRSNCSLISILLEMQDLKTIAILFEIPLNDYWQKHYHFGKKGTSEHAVLGKKAFESICVNTLIPILISYAEHKNEPQYAQKAMRWISEIKAENNMITRIYEENGLKLKHAGDSQACLQWHKNYCSVKKCMSCEVLK